MSFLTFNTNVDKTIILILGKQSYKINNNRCVTYSNTITSLLLKIISFHTNLFPYKIVKRGDCDTIFL